MILSASILSADFASLKDQILQAETAGVDWIHVDVMDGHFVPNISMGPFILETCRRFSSLPLDVHLMIENPDRYIETFARAGAATISIHIENNPNVHRTLQAIRSLGVKAGIVVNPGTPACALTSVLPEVDMILVMTVNPGYSGQAFIPAVLPKITEIRRLLEQFNLNIPIQVDGGITADTLPAARAAGASIFVAATAIFKHPAGISAGINALRNSI